MQGAIQNVCHSPRGEVVVQNMAKCEIGNKPTSDISRQIIVFKIRIRIDLQFAISPLY